MRQNVTLNYLNLKQVATVICLDATIIRWADEKADYAR